VHEVDGVEVGGGTIEASLNVPAAQRRIIVCWIHVVMRFVGLRYHAFFVKPGNWQVDRELTGDDDVRVRWSPLSARLLAIVSLLGHGLEHAVVPVTCVFCGARRERRQAPICDGCHDDLPWVANACRRCANPLAAQLPAGVHCAACQLDPPPFVAAIAPLEYSFPVDAAIKAMKFRRKLFYAPAFAHVLSAALHRLPGDIDGLLPVPLHWRRQALRGFNQSVELCRPMQRLTGLPPVRNVVRCRPTPYQSGLIARHRRRNLEKAFLVHGRIDSRHPLIVDDVITTGETCRQLAKVLLDAGAEKVSVLAVARA
jgi:ComF family protein